MNLQSIQNKVYAGVLGKIIGVYLGRPVEGWSYERIRSTFHDVYHYVNRQVGVPLIVADDDISGTFGFFRALADNGYSSQITAAQIGEAWRNYIIENKTILWWGGKGRSTEHTAYLNLIHGIDAPQSGSIAINGQSVAEQIGAQIFIEGYAMCYPNDPEKTAALVKKAASVSHDGMAVDAACHLAAMDALAFEETNIDRILDHAYSFVSDDRLKKLICDVRNICAKHNDWRDTRQELDTLYGYHLYPGTCHIAPNHAMVLASILHGENDFQKSVMIAASAGWDTDCNAGNVGAFNGIRLGLSGIDAGADLRSEVADRLYVITADGGSAVSDAVQEADKIVTAIGYLHDKSYVSPKKPRFSFSYPGSLQGFCKCPVLASPGLNMNVSSAIPGKGIGISCSGLGRGLNASVSTPTSVDFNVNDSSYLSTASPSLYPGQTVLSHVQLVSSGSVSASIYCVTDNGIISSDPVSLNGSVQEISWKIPSNCCNIIQRIGITLSSSTHFTGEVRLLDMDWHGAPDYFVQSGTLMSHIWDLHPKGLQIWTSSAENFAPDMNYTFCISHPKTNGLSTLGTHDWDDYTVSANVNIGLCDSAGLVIRCNGHREYYAAAIDLNSVSIIRMAFGQRHTLVEKELALKRDCWYKLAISAIGDSIILYIDGEPVLSTTDTTFSCGGCGFFIDSGTMLADCFTVFNSQNHGM